MSKQICSACGATVSRYDGVSVGYKEGTKFLCSRCYNESIAEYSGLDYEHVSFDPLTLQDLDGVPHTFQFRPHIFGDQLSLQALEVGPDEGYEFSVIADAEQDLFVTFQRLFGWVFAPLVWLMGVPFIAFSSNSAAILPCAFPDLTTAHKTPCVTWKSLAPIRGFLNEFAMIWVTC